MKSSPDRSPPAAAMTRRTFLGLAAALPMAGIPSAQAASRAVQRPPTASLAGEIGITTGSFMQHLRRDPKLHETLLLDLPQRMREELGLRVIDVMSETFASFDDGYIDRLRERADRHGCIFTNVKMNQTVNMGSVNPAERREAMTLYRQMVAVAQRLGCRWVRPALRGSFELKLLIADFRELIDYGAPKGISLLVEVLPGMRKDPDAIPRFISAVGPGIAACPDLAGWPPETLYDGLRKAFPLAVTCDFKAQQFGPNGEHPQYDLRRCFQVGREAGFRGPWCMEHFNETLDGLWRGFAHLSGLLRQWMKER